MAECDWRDIPGYNGMYQVSFEGEVRTWRWRGEHKMSQPRILAQYMRHKGRKSRARFVKLTDSNGRAKEVKVLSLMVDVWLGGGKTGKVPYHKNGDLADHCVNNIGFMTRTELGKKTGAKSSKRKPVAKIDTEGNVVEIYTSARSAAKANHMSYQTVLDRCAGKVKNPFALDGYNYAFD